MVHYMSSGFHYRHNTTPDPSAPPQHQRTHPYTYQSRNTDSPRSTPHCSIPHSPHNNPQSPQHKPPPHLRMSADTPHTDQPSYTSRHLHMTHNNSHTTPHPRTAALRTSSSSPHPHISLSNSMHNRAAPPPRPSPLPCPYSLAHHAPYNNCPHYNCLPQAKKLPPRQKTAPAIPSLLSLASQTSFLFPLCSPQNTISRQSLIPYASPLYNPLPCASSLLAHWANLSRHLAPDLLLSPIHPSPTNISAIDVASGSCLTICPGTPEM